MSLVQSLNVRLFLREKWIRPLEVLPAPPKKNKLKSMCTGKKVRSEFFLIHFYRHINWNRQFNLIRIDKLCEKFSTKYDLSYIKIFNINSMYWLKSYDLLDCISEMKNLHTLLALDTQLDLFESHCEVYKKLPLKKVALTVDLTRKINYQKSVHYACPQVEELCFKYLISRDTIMKPFCPFRYLHPSILKYQKIKELVVR